MALGSRVTIMSMVPDLMEFSRDWSWLMGL